MYVSKILVRHFQNIDEKLHAFVHVSYILVKEKFNILIKKLIFFFTPINYGHRYITLIMSDHCYITKTNIPLLVITATKCGCCCHGDAVVSVHAAAVDTSWKISLPAGHPRVGGATGSTTDSHHCLRPGTHGSLRCAEEDLSFSNFVQGFEECCFVCFRN